ncbi:MAG: hypothetical protein R3A48_04245 [Polyangiales bacterium]
MNDWLDRDLNDADFIEEEPAGLISDEVLDQIARCELAQRFLWAVEVGVDPLRGDLLALAPTRAPRVSRAA